jgi:hypothetical protein
MGFRQTACRIVYQTLEFTVARSLLLWFETLGFSVNDDAVELEKDWDCVLDFFPGAVDDNHVSFFHDFDLHPG